MSAKIDRSSLTDEQVKTIARLLVMKPKEKFRPGKNFYSQPATKLPIKAFHLDSEKNEVIVPYTFYKGLSQSHPNCHKSFPHVPFKFTHELYEQQIQIANDALTHLDQYGTTTLNIYTGSGKTVLGAYLAAQKELLTLVLYPSTVLGPQWKNTFEEFTDARVWIVGEDFPEEGAHIILCMDTRFDKLPQDYVDKIGMVIIDEAHEFCTPTRFRCFLGVQPKYVIAATATFERDDGMHELIQAVCGMHRVYKISTKPFNVYKYMTGIDIPLEKNVQGTPDWSKYCRNLCLCEDRNLMILDTVRKNPQNKILILTWRADHVNFLYDCLVKMGISVDKMVGTKKTYQDSHVLIGTISKLSTGFDEKAACANFNGIRINLLLLVGSMRSVQLLEQVAGRSFRSEFPHIVCFVDDSKISENHWKVGQKWFKSRNGSIFEVKSQKMLEREQAINSSANSSANGNNLANSQLQKLAQLNIIDDDSIVINTHNSHSNYNNHSNYNTYNSHNTYNSKQEVDYPDQSRPNYSLSTTNPFSTPHVDNLNKQVSFNQASTSAKNHSMSQLDKLRSMGLISD